MHLNARTYLNSYIVRATVLDINRVRRERRQQQDRLKHIRQDRLKHTGLRSQSYTMQHGTWREEMQAQKQKLHFLSTSPTLRTSETTT